MFKSVMGYMGDVSLQFPLMLVQEIVEKATACGPPLQTELYMQLMKQLSDNPNPESEHKGWQLMALSLGCFPPDAMVEHFLEYFLRNHARPHPTAYIYLMYQVVMPPTAPPTRLPVGAYPPSSPPPLSHLSSPRASTSSCVPDGAARPAQAAAHKGEDAGDAAARLLQGARRPAQPAPDGRPRDVHQGLGLGVQPEGVSGRADAAARQANSAGRRLVACSAVMGRASDNPSHGCGGTV